jgi:hypothetical protein
MRRLLLLLACWPAALPAQADLPPALRTLLDSTIADLKTWSLYAEQADWPALEAEARSAATAEWDGPADDPRRLAPAWTALLGGLHDHHGRFLVGGQPVAWCPYERATRHRDERPRDPATARATGYGEVGHAAARLDDGTGYLRIGAVGPFEDPQAVAGRLRFLLDSLARGGARRWIVDLRANGGGNIFPMATGIAPLFPMGVFGRTVDASGEPFGSWTVDSAGFTRDGYRPATLPPGPAALAAQPVAVLAGRYTTSSGEILAVGFRGRDRTRLFGEATGGYTQETNWAPYRGGVIGSWSISRYADRLGTVYPDHVPVDEPLPEAANAWRPGPATPEALARDPVVRAANAWLRSVEPR